MSEFKIDFFELAFLAEVCIPPVPIARGMFFDKLTTVYYNNMIQSERDRLFDWIGSKVDLSNEDCKIFHCRFNPNNQYLITTTYNKIQQIHKCFLMNDKYYTSKNISIDKDFINSITKFNPKHP